MEMSARMAHTRVTAMVRSFAIGNEILIFVQSGLCALVNKPSGASAGTSDLKC